MLMHAKPTTRATSALTRRHLLVALTVATGGLALAGVDDIAARRVRRRSHRGRRRNRNKKSETSISTPGQPGTPGTPGTPTGGI